MINFLNWVEAKKSRGRMVVLFSTVFVYLSLTIALFVCVMYGVILPDNVNNLFLTLTGLMTAIYGFYTGTSSDKSSAVANKAADLMLDKMNQINVSNGSSNSTNTNTMSSAKPSVSMKPNLSAKPSGEGEY